MNRSAIAFVGAASLAVIGSAASAQVTLPVPAPVVVNPVYAAPAYEGRSSMTTPGYSPSSDNYFDPNEALDRTPSPGHPEGGENVVR